MELLCAAVCVCAGISEECDGNIIFSCSTGCSYKYISVPFISILIHLFEKWSDGERKRSFMYLFIPQMATVAGLRPAQNQYPGTLLQSPT